MKATAWIAINVFRESVRDKVLYNLVLFAIILMAASYLIGQLTAGQDVKIIKDLGLAATSVFGLFIAVFIGIGLVSKEVERRSIYNLLSKPVHRYQVIAGKYIGLVLTLVVNVAIMAVALYAVLYYMSWNIPLDMQGAWDTVALDPRLLKAVALILVELMVVTAIALTSSRPSRRRSCRRRSPSGWSSPATSARTSGTSTRSWRRRRPRGSREALYWVLPNLSQFDVKARVVHGQPVPFGYIATSTAYGLLYIAVLLVVAIYVFSRRDFK